MIVENEAQPEVPANPAEKLFDTLPISLRALKHRNFRLFFFGQMISLVGTWLQSVGQAWLIWRLTHSPLLLGMVTFTGQLPVFLLAVFGGLMADRMNKRKVLLFTQTAAMLLALTLAALTISGGIKIWEIFSLAALLGVVNAIDMPTRQSFFIDMVGVRSDVINAIALNSSIVTGARIVGPAIGGVVIFAVGEGWCFFLNGISYVAVITGLLLMNLKSNHRSNTGLDSNPLHELKEVFHYIFTNPGILRVLVLLGTVSLLGMPVQTLMPVLANKVFHRDADGLGILLSAMGIGSLMGASYMASRRNGSLLAKQVIIGACGVGLSMFCVSFSHHLTITLMLLVPLGVSMMIQIAGSNTYIQTLVPDSLRGRIMSIYTIMFIGMTPFGSLLAGVLGKYVGTLIAIRIGAAACLIGTGIIALGYPSIKKQLLNR